MQQITHTLLEQSIPNDERSVILPVLSNSGSGIMCVAVQIARRDVRTPVSVLVQCFGLGHHGGWFFKTHLPPHEETKEIRDEV